MSTERNYEKVSGGSDNARWEPHKSNQPVDPNNQPKLEGYYTDCKEIKGPNGMFNVHTIQTINEDGTLGQSFDCSLGAVMDDILGTKIKLGSFVCVVYKGKKPSKTPGRSYNDIDVFQDKNAVPFNQLKVADGVTSNFSTQPVNNGAGAGGQRNSGAAAPTFGDDDLPF